MPTIQTAQQLNQALRRGADHTGSNSTRAAVHLLTFIGLLLPSDVHRGAVRLLPADPPTALLTDWRQLRTLADQRRLYGGGQKLLALATALALNDRFDLGNATTGLGWAHQLRVAEALLIAAGVADLVDLHPTEQLQRMIRERDAMLTPPAVEEGTTSPVDPPRREGKPPVTDLAYELRRIAQDAADTGARCKTNSHPTNPAIHHRWLRPCT